MGVKLRVLRYHLEVIYFVLKIQFCVNSSILLCFRNTPWRHQHTQCNPWRPIELDLDISDQALFRPSPLRYSPRKSMSPHDIAGGHLLSPQLSSWRYWNGSYHLVKEHFKANSYVLMNIARLGSYHLVQGHFIANSYVLMKIARLRSYHLVEGHFIANIYVLMKIARLRSYHLVEGHFIAISYVRENIARLGSYHIVEDHFTTNSYVLMNLARLDYPTSPSGASVLQPKLCSHEHSNARLSYHLAQGYPRAKRLCSHLDSTARLRAMPPIIPFFNNKQVTTTDYISVVHPLYGRQS